MAGGADSTSLNWGDLTLTYNTATNCQVDHKLFSLLPGLVKALPCALDL